MRPFSRQALAALGALVALSLPGGADAQLMRLLSPGDLTRSHAKVEDCKKCHNSFKGAIPNKKCLACHRVLADRIIKGKGSHAGMGSKACVECHSDHKGRGFNSIKLNERGFDHAGTGFLLTDGHKGRACTDCHKRKGRFGGLTSACKGCHKDNHDGSLGAACVACHGTKSWKPLRAKSDHKVSMKGSHAPLKCASCHAGGKHLDAKNSCKTCHKDPHNGNADRCGSCHKPTRWEEHTFDHDTCAMGLTGKHVKTECVKCHVGWKFGGVPQNCAGCHTRKPKHGALGECGKCHDTRAWRKHTFKHSKSKFALTGKHQSVDCRHCHTGGKFNDLKGKGRNDQCLDCHVDTPKHGDFGNCTPCHDTTGAVGFDHGGETRPTTQPVRAPTKKRPIVVVTSYPLRDAHLTPSCKTCHQGKAKLGPGGSDCVGCHKDEDPHEGQFKDRGDACEACHIERTWAPSLITAAKHLPERFPLKDGHVDVECSDCHDRGIFVGVPTDCASCHMDVHAGRLGEEGCEGCHDPRAWAPVEGFAARHDTLSFRVTGAHGGVDCNQCHGAKPRRQFTEEQAARCVTCHADDDTHGGGFGPKCEDCHRSTSAEAGWDDRAPFEHKETGFTLEAAHSNVPCGDCHLGGGAPPPVAECGECHSDPHGGATPFECGECHAPTAWQVPTFNHSATAWPLKGMHLAVDCRTCHLGNTFIDLSADCASCHGHERPPDAVHLGLPTWECRRCHKPVSWPAATFNHSGETGFALRWAHKPLTCSDCHSMSGRLPGTECEDCHTERRPSSHNWVLPACGDCHRETMWLQTSRIGGGFTHDGMGSDRPGLRGSHAITDCASCHNAGGDLTGTTCSDCHSGMAPGSHSPDWRTRCEDCHESYPGWPRKPNWMESM